MGSRIRASAIHGSMTLLLLTGLDLACKVETPPARLLRVQNPQAVGAVPFVLRIEGQFLSDQPIQVGPHTLRPSEITETSVRVEVPAMPRGQYPVHFAELPPGPLSIEVLNSPPRLVQPGPQLVMVGEKLQIQLNAEDFDGDTLTIDLPESLPGMQYNLLSSVLEFQPGPSQVGQTFQVSLRVHDGFEGTSTTLHIRVPARQPTLLLTDLSPRLGPGGQSFELLVRGDGFTPSCAVYLNGLQLEAKVISARQIKAKVPALARGTYGFKVMSGIRSTPSYPLHISNAPPRLMVPEGALVKEHRDGVWRIDAEDIDGDRLRLHIRDLPPGAHFDEGKRQLSLSPDFIQGGQTYQVRAIATDGVDTSTRTFSLRIEDSIAPPWPKVVSQDQREDHTRIRLDQVTDDFLDSPGMAGRSFDARVSVPTAATADNRYPVRVFLHGFGGKPYTGGEGDQFRIYPHDPENTYWWGYSARAPLGLSPGPVHPYTARRVLHLVEWVLRHYPGADPDRVYINGTSMGGAGAAAIGLIWARHFMMVDSMIGQTIARNHRPSRIKQLSEFYGSPRQNLVSMRGMSAWDQLDLVRLFADSPQARQQFIFSRHAKDDPIIHFGAAVQPSRHVGIGWLAALQTFKVGHLSVWDEGAHGPPDPVMGKNWWDDHWDRVNDERSWLSRNTAFIAFSHSEADQDPGDGRGNGRQPWNEERGFAGQLQVAGDTGWSGAPAGAFNRYLRWDASTHIDTWAYFSMAVQFRTGAGRPSPQEGYPALKAKYEGPMPVHVDLTPRRVQAFICRPGEVIRWRFADLQGQVTADKDGALTVPHLPLTEAWVALELRRGPVTESK